MPNALDNNTRLRIAVWCHGIVLFFSVVLVAYISVDTFHVWRLSSNTEFLAFQLFVCVVFLVDFFVELWIAPNRRKFFMHNLLFLLVSIPYINIIVGFDIRVSEHIFYYLRFLPLLRGAYVMVRSVGYLSKIRIVSIFWSYISLMVLALYFGSLMFYWREHPVNPDILTFGNSMYFCATQMTTLGCNIYPVTPAGRIVAAVLSVLGMAMFPLFTVYISSLVRRVFNKQDARTGLLTANRKEKSGTS